MLTLFYLDQQVYLKDKNKNDIRFYLYNYINYERSVSL